MNKTINEQISRMKAMMEYSHAAGESNKSYSSVEYQSIAADGKNPQRLPSLKFSLPL